MGRKKEASLEDVRFEVSRVCSCLNMLDERLKALAPKSNFPEIPPAWVLKAAHNNLDRTRHWIEYFHVLADYYGVQRVNGSYVDVNLKPDRIAEYRTTEKAIYSKTPEMTEHTALHEFWHHMVNVLRLNTRGEEEQALANAFADACIEVQKAP